MTIIKINKKNIEDKFSNIGDHFTQSKELLDEGKKHFFKRFNGLNEDVREYGWKGVKGAGVAGVGVVAWMLPIGWIPLVGLATTVAIVGGTYYAGKNAWKAWSAVKMPNEQSSTKEYQRKHTPKKGEDRYF